ncbi:hypothetical protein LIER_09780 [Lithospermum erythrorhizon]|uniref:Pentatricopeptide repeat-containing protein n=1 Tax=Lithospermum erythrorhizon TaxID=34254 RepID=A0AAV3PIM3_LITER
MYILCRCFYDAFKLFNQLNLCYASPWNWMIRGFTMMGWFEFAMLYFIKMLSFGTCPDKYTFPYVVKACSGLNGLNLGKWVHVMVKRLDFETDVFVGSALIKFYAEHGCVDDARLLFDRLPRKDDVLWNVILNGYLKHGVSKGDVVDLFLEMRGGDVRPNSVTYSCILSACGSEGMVLFGGQIHGEVIKNGLEVDPSVTNSLAAMYTKCHCLFDARELFGSIRDAGLVTWNVMIGGYVQNGLMPEALELFQEMISMGVKPDNITFSSLLPAISELENVKLGKEIHGYIMRQGVPVDLFLKNALIDMYLKCRNVELACQVFEDSRGVDVVICSSMISGLVLNGKNDAALETFRWMLLKQMRPNAVTLASLLPACAGLGIVRLGKELHGNILRKGMEEKCYVGSAIIDMYAKCARLDLAHEFFVRMSEKDSVCWNTMITSFSQNAKPEQAIEIFRLMGVEKANYDAVSISGALCACANLPALLYGREIHSFMIRGALDFDMFTVSALIDMYAKCGNLNVARRAFDMMNHRNEVSWNSMIAAYGSHGQVKECLSLFNEMESNGFQPDHVTFLAIISACGHTGKVEEGKLYFNYMTQNYRFAARMEHYASMIDLLGRAGRLVEAFQLIESMPFTPDAGIWGTLLGACCVHGNIELAEMASNHLFGLDPQNSGYYVLLSNLQATAGKFDKSNTTRNMMKDRSVQKIPGYSWIEVSNATHMFIAADITHPKSDQIYVMLEHLLLQLQKEGYSPQSHIQMQHLDLQYSV